jgi:hypothetical protein
MARDTRSTFGDAVVAQVAVAVHDAVPPLRVGLCQGHLTSDIGEDGSEAGDDGGVVVEVGQSGQSSLISTLTTPRQSPGWITPKCFGSSATLGTYSTLRGNILALASTTVTTGSPSTAEHSRMMRPSLWTATRLRLRVFPRPRPHHHDA